MPNQELIAKISGQLDKINAEHTLNGSSSNQEIIDHLLSPYSRDNTISTLLAFLRPDDVGFEILIELLESDEDFRQKFIADERLIPTILQIGSHGDSILYLLLVDAEGQKIIINLRRDNDFKNRLTIHPQLVETILTINHYGKLNSSCLMLFADNEILSKMLGNLILNEEFRQKLITNDNFLPSLLHVEEWQGEEGDEYNTSSLSYFAHENFFGLKVFENLLFDPLVTARLVTSNLDQFVNVLFKKMDPEGKSAFYHLINTTYAADFVRKLFANEAIVLKIIDSDEFFSSFSSVFAESTDLLEALLENKVVRNKLLQDERFIPALLNTNIDNPSALFSIFSHDEGINPVLNILFFEEKDFSKKLINHELFIKTLLRIESNGLSILHFLIVKHEFRPLLNHLLANKDFMDKLLADPKIVYTLLAVTISETSPAVSNIMYWLTYNGLTYLNIFLKNPTFRRNFLDNILPDFLTFADTAGNKNPYCLFLLTRSFDGIITFSDWLSDFAFSSKLLREPDINLFIESLFATSFNFYENDFPNCALSNLLSHPLGCKLLQNLLDNVVFREKFITRFAQITKSSLQPWFFQSPAGFSLLRFLMKEGRLDLANERPELLLQHKDIQLYIKLGLLDPNIFLFLAAIQNDDAIFLEYLQRFSPWARTEKGYYLKEIIETSALPEGLKQQRLAQLNAAITNSEQKIADANFVVAPPKTGTTQELAPSLPSVEDSANHFKIDGVEGQAIQEFFQYIEWIMQQEELSSYHNIFQKLLFNEAFRTQSHFSLILENLKKICGEFNYNIKNNLPIPSANQDWSQRFTVCTAEVLEVFKEMHEHIAGTELHRYCSAAIIDAQSEYCKLLNVPWDGETHLPKQEIAANAGLLVTIPPHDPYLNNFTSRQCRGVAQTAMATLINKQNFINWIVGELDIGTGEQPYNYVMERYVYYARSNIFPTNLSFMDFLIFITGNKELDSDYNSSTIKVKDNLKEELTALAISYVESSGFFKVQPEQDLLWYFLTLENPNALTHDERLKLYDFLDRCVTAADGLAIIQNCIEQHQDEVEKINIRSLCYKNSNNISIFSLLAANPVYLQWLLSYKITLVKLSDGRHDYAQIGIASPISDLSHKLMAPEVCKTNLIYQFSLTEPNLFFWILYLAIYEKALYPEISDFFIKSKCQYDNLGALLFDMQQSNVVRSDVKILVQNFLKQYIEEQIKRGDTNFWLTLGLLSNSQDIIIPIIERYPWVRKTLNSEENRKICYFLLKHDPKAIEEVERLRAQQTRNRNAFLTQVADTRAEAMEDAAQEEANADLELEDTEEEEPGSPKRSRTDTSPG